MEPDPGGRGARTARARQASGVPLRATRTPRVLALLLAGSLAGGCVDGDPHGLSPERSVHLALAPDFAVEESGAPATAALQKAYDRVNRFRVVARRLPSEERVRDTTFVVTPGAERHRLRLEVPLRTAEDEFVVELAALEDEIPMFRAEPVSVRPGVAVDPGEILAVEPPLLYAGPGVDAVELALRPDAVAAQLGSTGRAGAVVYDDAGEPVPDVPTAWEVGNEEVASLVDAGTVEGVSVGVTRLRATIPTGMSVEGPVYVVERHLLDFDTGPLGGGLGSGDPLNDVYVSAEDALPDVVLQPRGGGGCGDGATVFANDFVSSTDLTGNAVSPCDPLLEEPAEFSENLHGLVDATLEAPAARACILASGGSQGGQAVVRAYDEALSLVAESLSSRLAAGVAEVVCVEAGETGAGRIRTVRFAGAGDATAEFDDLEFTY